MLLSRPDCLSVPDCFGWCCCHHGNCVVRALLYLFRGPFSLSHTHTRSHSHNNAYSLVFYVFIPCCTCLPWTLLVQGLTDLLKKLQIMKGGQKVMGDIHRERQCKHRQRDKVSTSFNVKTSTAIEENRTASSK